MGTIAARDCLRVVELAETVASIGLLAGCQAVDLRGGIDVNARTTELHKFVRERIPLVTEDRRQDIDIQQVLELHRKGQLPGIGRGEGLDPKLVAEGGAPGDSA